MSLDLDTPVQNTWCAGCGNFALLQAVNMAFEELVDSKKVKEENLVISSGIGCYAKIFDYIGVNGFYSIHGRVPATLTGIKIANPKLKPVGFAGDGDAYDEGISHLIHAARRNIDITMVVHDNKVFALTTGQFTPTSPEGFSGKSTPKGSVEPPLNPLHLMLASGASFVARGFSGELLHLKELLIKAINHRGFSFIDVLQPCVTFYNLWDFYKDRVYDLDKTGHDVGSFDEAWQKADGNGDNIPIGLFYREERDTFENLILKNQTPVRGRSLPPIWDIAKDYI